MGSKIRRLNQEVQHVTNRKPKGEKGVAIIFFKIKENIAEIKFDFPSTVNGKVTSL